MGNTTKRWSYIAGEKGRNRVRVFETASGVIKLDFSDGNKRKRISLGTRDQEQAKRKADDAAAKLARRAALTPSELTLGKLFDMYGDGVTPTKSADKQKHDRRTIKMYEEHFGRDRVVASLGVQDWDGFIADRRSGRTRLPGGRSSGAVRDRIVEYDLRFLMAVLNYGTRVRNGCGQVLLESNPFAGETLPRETNPTRVVLTDAEYVDLLGCSEQVDWRFRVCLVLAHETGHRVGAIRGLQWRDIDLARGTILWRAENEKTGFEHVTPITEAARAALEEVRRRSPGIGEAPVLPAPKDPSRPISRHLARNWWKRGEKLAGLKPVRRRGWHSLRRKFVSDLMHKPLKVVCQLGGWKSAQTVLMCYQHADQDELRDALADRRTDVLGA